VPECVGHPIACEKFMVSLVVDVRSLVKSVSAPPVHSILTSHHVDQRGQSDFMTKTTTTKRKNIASTR
jgi:hypothetical protein